MRESVLKFSDQHGNSLDITFSEMTRENNREFGAKCRAQVLQQAEQIARDFPGLQATVQNLVTDVCITKCELPSPSGLTFAFSSEGTRLLIELLTRRAHPTPLDTMTIDRIMQERFSEAHGIIRDLLPIPKVTGATSQTPK